MIKQNRQKKVERQKNKKKTTYCVNNRRLLLSLSYRYCMRTLTMIQWTRDLYSVVITI